MMEDFFSELSKTQDPYDGPYHSDDIFKLTRDAVRDTLKPIFSQIKKAALQGLGDLDIKEELTDDQVWLLEKLKYTVNPYDEEDEEYEQGFRYSIVWFDQYWEPEEEEDLTGE